MKVRKTLLKYLPLFVVIAIAAGAYYYFFVEVSQWEPCTYDKKTGTTKCKLPPDEPQDFDEWENEGWCGVRIDNETWANAERWKRRDYRYKKEDWRKSGKCPGDPGYYKSQNDDNEERRGENDYAEDPIYSGTCDKQSSASLLGVSVGASKAQVKSAFREKSKSAHPDTNPGDPSAESRFRALSDAKDCLLKK